MTIDISHVGFWAPDTTLLFWVWVGVVVFFLALTIIGLLFDRDAMAGIGLGLMAISIFLGGLVFAGTSARYYDSRVHSSKTLQLEEHYSNVQLTGDKFTASLEGKYVSGALIESEPGKFQVVELEEAK